MYGHRHIHLIGIGGVGMQGIAEVLLTLGYEVSGSDLKESAMLAHLRALGGRVEIGHRAENLGRADCVVLSSAIPEQNPERLAALERGIPVISRAEMLGELMRTKYAVAVAGAHGKTTTTSLVAAVLTAGELDPTVVVGGVIRATGTGARLGSGDYLVAEADESDGSFLKLLPSVAVVTNLDREHLNHFGSMAALENAFLAFVERVPFYGAAVLCVDDPRVKQMAAEVTRRVRTYGLTEEADLYASNLRVDGMRTTYSVAYRGTPVGDVVLNMPGRHNVQNSLAAIAVGMEFGLAWPAIQAGLADFGGVRRRFDTRGGHGGLILVDDYGHHPTEIAAVLATARASWPDRKLNVIFQPHRYSRTLDLRERFAEVFHEADRVILCPIYAAGERPIEGVTAEWLAEAIRAGSEVPVTVTRDVDEAGAMLAAEGVRGEVWMTLGAGDVAQLAANWSANEQAAGC